MTGEYNNNQVILKGTMDTEPVFSHEVHGQRFYHAVLCVKRSNGFADRIPLILAEILLNDLMKYKGISVKVKGEYRSRTVAGKGVKHLQLYVFAKELAILPVASEKDVNEVYLQGYLCKKAVYRKTPLGKEIADLLLAVNISCRRSYYLPCICWGEKARKAEDIPVGKLISIKGKIHSREYDKVYADGREEKHTAYELSVLEWEWEGKGDSPGK